MNEFLPRLIRLIRALSRKICRFSAYLQQENWLLQVFLFYNTNNVVQYSFIFNLTSGFFL